ncbi:peptidoglycan-binding domain-containing protein (plasmid) [Paenibacillus sp. EC2-1]|uniref:peptidoglycan-binding domain-containing protein n=1 Tax=Paenibacillus sp. EC2-1 TaxID=3388665 RepID=UPI003BEEE1FE
MTKRIPQGVRWVDNGRPQNEYQLFPEEYFSAADATIYFGDIWMDDITNLQFGLVEKTNPLFGYADKTWAHFMRGSRLVTGSFRIAFREAGFMYTVIDHIGQLKSSRPTLSFLLAGEERPKWYGDVKQRLEEVIGGWQSSKAAKKKTRKVPRWTSATLKKGMVSDEVMQLQISLYGRGFYNGVIEGKYDDETVAAVKAYQKSKGYAVTGIADAKIKDDFSDVETYVVPNEDYGSVTPNGQAEPRMVEYEKNVWGYDTVKRADDVRNQDTYFYRGRTTEINGFHPEWLFQNGIDIYINYGPLDEFVKGRDKILQEATFNTTVKAIRNVQLTGVAQVLDPRSGEPIEEVYQFMAQDMD